jgi:hypothetical protein
MFDDQQERLKNWERKIKIERDFFMKMNEKQFAQMNHNQFAQSRNM